MFTKKSAPEAEPVATTRNTAETTFSVLGPDTSIKGDLTASSDLHLDGRIEGDIVCSSLVQGETGEIIGGITSESARLAGKVRGSVVSRELVIHKTAHIHGDVQYDTLTIEQGAIIEGRLSPRGSPQADDRRSSTTEDMLILTQAVE